LGSSKNFNSYELTASPHFIFNTGVKETDFWSIQVESSKIWVEQNVKNVVFQRMFAFL
jgi:hypothetical protein